MYIHRDINKLRVVCGECLREKRDINYPAIDITDVYERKDKNHFIIPISWNKIENFINRKDVHKELTYKLSVTCNCGVCDNNFNVNGIRYVTFDKMTGYVSTVVCEIKCDDMSCTFHEVSEPIIVSNL